MPTKRSTGPKEYPYCFCETCGKLSPVLILTALRLYKCKICTYVISPIEDSTKRLVWLTKDEATVRGLKVVRGKVEE